MQIDVGKLIVLVVCLILVVTGAGIYKSSVVYEVEGITSIFPERLPTCLTVNLCKVRLYSDGAWLLSMDGEIIRQLESEEFDVTQLPKTRSIVIEVANAARLGLERKEL